jgi:RNA polymerase sigma factor (sigma-70 family)
MTTQLTKVVQHLRRAGQLRAAGELTDGQLLECFVSRHEGTALETLVRRHGPMVWGVCRRVLRNHHDAEDAFQAAFLVLVRKAASVRPREMVGNWLYGVARQTALKARATATRRRTRERQGTDMPEPAAKEPDFDDVLAVLDQELSALPDKYRAAIVLCDLEGKTRKEAARQLGVPEGTLAARVARGRAMLAKRLARHGLIVSSGALAGLLSQRAVPAAVMSATIKTVRLLAAGQATGAVAARVAHLTEGVLKTMLLTRAKSALGIGLVVGLLMLGSVFGYHTFAADKPAPPPKDRLADTLILLDKQWWEAASKHDVDTLSKILADDWVGFDRGVSPSPDSPPWTKAASLKNYRGWRFTEVKFVKDREVFRIDEHTALMVYEVKWRSEGKDGNRSSGQSRYVRCWVQRDGGWFVKHTECLNLPAPAEESAPLIVPLPPDVKIVPLPPDTKPEPAWKRGARASGSWGTEVPENAFDGKHNTDWNAGDYAPAWIERDLGASLPLASIALFPCQDIPGATTHKVWVSNEPIGNDRSKAKLVHTFKGETTNLQALKFDFPKDLSARYVEVRTTQSPTWIAWWEVEIRVWKQGKVAPLTPAAPVTPVRPAHDHPERLGVEALQGTWQVVAVERGGKDVTGQTKEEWEVTGQSINVKEKAPRLITSASFPSLSFSVDPDKSPKEINITFYVVGLGARDHIEKGIYTLDGDVWKICLTDTPLVPGRAPRPKEEARPKELVTKEGSGTELITLRRVTPR